MLGCFETHVFDGAGDAGAADVGGMFGEGEKFGERN